MKTPATHPDVSAVSFMDGALGIQKCALAGERRAVRVGSVIFFSCEAGDAWMVEPLEGLATCLTLGFKNRPIPIREINSTEEIGWDAEYRIEGDSFFVRSLDGQSSGVMSGYPTAEIERLAEASPALPAALTAYGIAVERLRTGRNAPCPCGSGKKYKKCCLANDELSARQPPAMDPMGEEDLAELPPFDAGDPLWDGGRGPFDSGGK